MNSAPAHSSEQLKELISVLAAKCPGHGTQFWVKLSGVQKSRTLSASANARVIRQHLEWRKRENMWTRVNVNVNDSSQRSRLAIYNLQKWVVKFLSLSDTCTQAFSALWLFVHILNFLEAPWDAILQNPIITRPACSV